MGRTGFRADDDAALEQLCRAVTMPNFVPEGIFTHFAVSDEFGDSFTQEQFSRFLRTVTAAESKSGVHFEIRHCTNSGAMVNYEEMYLDMVRPGVALYGCYPAQERGKLDLIPAMELKTRIAVITEHRAGDTISYGRTYTVPHDMRVAVIQIGYADGLHRVLSNKIEVLICGKRAKQIGRICMDMCMVDITDIPEAKEGDVAVIFGRDLPIEEQAEKAGTISYELLCGVSPRVPRVYID
jgi:alanine racemase